MTWAEKIEAVAGDETIEGVCIGDGAHDDENRGSIRGWTNDDERDIEPKYIHKLMHWKDARPLLDYEFDSGYGGTDCHPIYAWTFSKVIVCAVYDGATWVQSVPRNPCSNAPCFIGGQ